MIICGMFGIGKTYLAKSRGEFMDLERFIFQDEVALFQNAVKEYHDIYGYHILTNCRPETLKELSEFECMVVVPDKSLKSEYLTRYIKRDSEPKWIENEMMNWNNIIDNAMKCKNVVVLKSGEYLSDRIDEILEVYDE